MLGYEGNISVYLVEQTMMMMKMMMMVMKLMKNLSMDLMIMHLTKLHSQKFICNKLATPGSPLATLKLKQKWRKHTGMEKHYIDYSGLPNK